MFFNKIELDDSDEKEFKDATPERWLAEKIEFHEHRLASGVTFCLAVMKDSEGKTGFNIWTLDQEGYFMECCTGDTIEMSWIDAQAWVERHKAKM